MRIHTEHFSRDADILGKCFIKYKYRLYITVNFYHLGVKYAEKQDIAGSVTTMKLGRTLKPRVAMMSSFSSLLPLDVVVMVSTEAAKDDNVGIMTTPWFQCLYSFWTQKDPCITDYEASAWGVLKKYHQQLILYSFISLSPRVSLDLLMNNYSLPAFFAKMSVSSWSSDAKSLPETMVTYCRLDYGEQTSVRKESSCTHFLPRKRIWNCRLQNGSHLAQDSN